MMPNLETRDGRKLKLAGCENVLAAATAPHRSWIFAAQQKLDALARSGRYFTSEDVVKDLRVKPHHCNAIGALIAHAARRGEIRRIGSVQARHRAARARWIGFWKGTQENETY